MTHSLRKTFFQKNSFHCFPCSGALRPKSHYTIMGFLVFFLTSCKPIIKMNDEKTRDDITNRDNKDEKWELNKNTFHDLENFDIKTARYPVHAILLQKLVLQYLVFKINGKHSCKIFFKIFFKKYSKWEILFMD